MKTREKIEFWSLNEAESSGWDAFVESCPAGLLYYGEKWLRLCEKLAGPAEVIVLQDHGNIVAGLPWFLLRSHHGVAIANSGAVFGSHGGPLLSPCLDATDRSKVVALLTTAFRSRAAEAGCATSLVIENPLESNLVAPATGLLDQRIGQLLDLTSIKTPEDLLDGYHQKTRNSVRKGLKCGFTFASQSGAPALRRLHEMHLRNMQEIGGREKKLEFFDAINDIFSPSDDYVVFEASLDARCVASLLVFYYNGTAEYYVPATESQFRSFQPMSALVHLALQDSVQRGLRWWNWGGTHPGQEGVYRFKSRWGGVDRPYRYHVVEHLSPNPLRMLSARTLQEEFSLGYAIPFNALSPV